MLVSRVRLGKAVGKYFQCIYPMDDDIVLLDPLVDG